MAKGIKGRRQTPPKRPSLADRYLRAKARVEARLAAGDQPRRRWILLGSRVYTAYCRMYNGSAQERLPPISTGSRAFGVRAGDCAVGDVVMDECGRVGVIVYLNPHSRVRVRWKGERVKVKFRAQWGRQEEFEASRQSESDCAPDMRVQLVAMRHTGESSDAAENQYFTGGDSIMATVDKVQSISSIIAKGLHARHTDETVIKAVLALHNLEEKEVLRRVRMVRRDCERGYSQLVEKNGTWRVKVLGKDAVKPEYRRSGKATGVESAAAAPAAPKAVNAKAEKVTAAVKAAAAKAAKAKGRSSGGDAKPAVAKETAAS